MPLFTFSLFNFYFAHKLQYTVVLVSAPLKFCILVLCMSISNCLKQYLYFFYATYFLFFDEFLQLVTISPNSNLFHIFFVHSLTTHHIDFLFSMSNIALAKSSPVDPSCNPLPVTPSST